MDDGHPLYTTETPSTNRLTEELLTEELLTDRQTPDRHQTDNSLIFSLIEKYLRSQYN
jgi:hypothetical protein